MAGKFVENYKKRFVNPYNFIPLMESCSRSVPTAEFEDCYTGYFDRRIKLLANRCLYQIHHLLQDC